MLEFLKLYEDMSQLFEPYNDEECGRLFRAMMAYAFDGVEPEFTGNERFIWPVLRRHIQQCNTRAETLRGNGAKGGRPKTKQNQTEPNETKQNQTEPDETLQEQEHIQEQEHTVVEARARAREAAPAADDGIAYGIDGSDMTQAMRDNEAAQRLVAQYMPTGRQPIEFDPRTGEVAILIAEHGADRVEEALKKAVSSDNRGGVSVSFLKAILTNKGGGKPKPGGSYQRRNYTADDFSSMEINIEELAN